MSLANYDDYKDSGFQWLGDVPAHWEIKRLSIVCHFESGKAHEPFIHDDGDYICVNSRFVSTDGESRKFCTENFSPAQRADILMVMSDLPNGRALAKAFFVDDDQPYAVNQRVCIIRAQQAIPKFLYYQLNRNPLFLRHDDGVNQTHLSNATFTKFPTLVPPLEEQKAISSFLDAETSKIDGLVAEQRRLIELLKEKRQAVISHAVTKGLNPNAPMKPSGIQWLGDVPDHWEVVPIKHLCSLLKDGTHLPPPRVDDGIPLLSVRNLVDGSFVLRDDDSMISQESYDDLCRAFVPAAGDVSLAIVGATLGKTAVIPDGLGDFHIQRSVGIFRTHPRRLAGMFLNLVFQSSQFQSKLWELVGYSAQPGIYLGTLQNLRVPVPPEKEQDEIVELITHRADRLTKLLAEAERAIELLKERRTALISAAVTGKIDVREFAYQEMA